MEHITSNVVEVGREGGTDQADQAREVTDLAAYSLAAEVRAVEEGHLARVLDDGSLLVKASSRYGSYRVRIRRVGPGDGVVVFGCTCTSGGYRARLPVPCKHAALAGRRLEREGLASWRDGVWRLRGRAALRAALSATIRQAA